MPPTYYAEDYEQITGQKIPTTDQVEAKVVAAPQPKKPTAKKTAEVK